MDHQALIQAYLDDELPPQQLAELSDWLAQDESNRETFVRASTLDTQIRRQLQNADLHRFLDQIDIHAIQEVIDQSPADESGAFAAVMNGHQNQEITFTSDISAGRAIGVLAHAGRQFVGQKLRQHAVPLGLAAVIALAVTLLIVFQSNSPTPDQLTPNVAQAPADLINPAAPHPVATLTATHNAQWAEGASAPGSSLYPNQHLTLTQGFAQITTRRGAVVILEAPCTVELTDNSNAIQLHAGKLVGICETDSSKGLLVRTPHMDVIDLGTRFGVAADEQASGVRVIKGEVTASSSSSGNDTAPTRLSAGQSAVVDQNIGQVVATDDFPGRFTTDWQAIVDVPGLTGPIRYEPSIPSDLRIGATEAEEVRLFHERSDILLKQAVEVNIIAPGRYEATDLLKAKILKDLRVDSYLVHFDSPDNSGAISRRNVSIRFDRPIVGVITASEQLTASHSQLGLPSVAYGNQSDWAAFGNKDSSGFDITSYVLNQGQNDAVRLSDDRRTLTLDLAIIDAIDQVRVLVASNSTVR